MFKKILIGALISTAAFAANQAEINVNDHDLEGQVRLDMKQMGFGSLEGSYVGARILNGHERNSDRIGNIDPLMEVSLMVQRPVEKVPGLAIGLGIKGEYTKFDGQNYSAVPLGVEADMKLPIGASIPFYLGGALYYAPSVLAFQDADSYLETRIHFDIVPIQNGRIEIGHRRIDTNVNQRDVRYNDSWYVGMRIDF